MPKRIRVLVVDDSAFMRKALVRMLSSDPKIEVLDTASDGEDGYRKAMKLRPDVVTLDVRMPGMDGITALRKIMSDCPVPVIMLSSLTSEGGEITLRALDIGAVDIIDKSRAHTAMDILEIAGELLDKVKAVAGVDVAKIARRAMPPQEARQEPYVPPLHSGKVDMIVVGASTGGPPALQGILAKLPADLPAAILIVQHMPVGFTASLAERLNRLAPIEISEAFDGNRVRPARCLIAPSGLHMTLGRDDEGIFVRLSEQPAKTLHRPSVDILMSSAAEVVGGRALGVLLTGMGADGARGLKAMHDAGGRTIAQDEESCVVYGMPKVAVELGGVDRSLPLQQIPDAILQELGAVSLG